MLKQVFGKMLKFVVILLWSLAGVNCTLKVYRRTETNDNAELYCESINSSLMHYNTEFLEASQKCGVPDVTISRSWYQNLGCFSAKQTIKKKSFTNNHLAECAKFCEEQVYRFIGVQTFQCLCYDSIGGIGFPGSCDDVECPGNANETCGVNHVIIYRKVTTLPNAECQYVSFRGNTFQLLTGSCDKPRHFICKDSTSFGVECIGDAITTDTTPGTVDVSTKGLVGESGTNLGLILGIIAAVLVIAVIVIVFLYVRIRRKKKYNDDRRHIQPRQGQSNNITPEDFINAYREPTYNNVKTGDPIVAFGGDGVDLDGNIPVYTAVRKKPHDKEKDDSAQTHDPAYDDVYEPSSKYTGQTDAQHSDNVNFLRHQNKPYHGMKFQNGRHIEGGYSRSDNSDQLIGGLHNQTQGSHVTEKPNEKVQNELIKNKLFRNSQNKLGSADDDLY